MRFLFIIVDCTEAVSLVGKKQESQFGHSVIKVLSQILFDSIVC